MPTIYLDNAATTPLDPLVKEVMMDILESFGNPSSSHALGRKSKSIIELYRKKVADKLSCSPSEIIFTSGATEADNYAILSSVLYLGVKTIISSPLEHHAVLNTLHFVERFHGVQIHFTKHDSAGNIQLNSLAELIKTYPNSLVSIMHGNNEIGIINPLSEIKKIAQDGKCYFHSDTVQSIGHLKFQESKPDFFCGSAHKFHGPKGIGFLALNRSLKTGPIATGGNQEKGIRGGTENLIGIVGLSTALDIAYSNFDSINKQLQELKNYTITQIQELFPTWKFNSTIDSSKSLPHILSLSVPSHPSNDMLLFKLDLSGICVSGGSACMSGALQGSHVLKELGVDGSNAVLRISFSKFNTTQDIDFLMFELKKLYF